MSKKSRRVAKARRALLALSLVLVTMLVAVGGTIAWLTAETTPVVNTFLPSNIALELKENYPTNGQANMIPGGVIAKDPHAIITNDVDAYLFVTIEESTEPDFDKYCEWAIADGWTVLEPEDVNDKTIDSYVIYRVVSKGDNQKFEILKENKVEVLTSVTKKMMDDIKDNQPKLTFTAYTIQKENGNGTFFTPEQAWEQVKPTPVTPPAGA